MDIGSCIMRVQKASQMDGGGVGGAERKISLDAPYGGLFHENSMLQQSPVI